MDSHMLLPRWVPSSENSRSLLCWNPDMSHRTLATTFLFKFSMWFSSSYLLPSRSELLPCLSASSAETGAGGLLHLAEMLSHVPIFSLAVGFFVSSSSQEWKLQLPRKRRTEGRRTETLWLRLP